MAKHLLENSAAALVAGTVPPLRINNIKHYSSLLTTSPGNGRKNMVLSLVSSQCIKVLQTQNVSNEFAKESAGGGAITF